MKNKSLIITVSIIVGLIAITVAMYFILKKKNKLPEFLNKKAENTETELQSVETKQENNYLSTLTKENILMLQKKMNEYLPDGEITEKLEEDGVIGPKTTAAFNYLSKKYNLQATSTETNENKQAPDEAQKWWQKILNVAN